MTAQAPYESLTTVESVQKAQADGRTVELNRAPRWEETNLRDEKNIAAFLRIGAEFRALAARKGAERAPVSAGGDALSLAIRFHETYERLAPSFGYETRTETRTFDPATPNGRLMVAVCGELLAALPERAPVSAGGDAESREQAPPHSLPTWSKCEGVIDNYEFHKRAAAGKEGPQLVTIDEDPREPTALERFIYEYDDTDKYKSAWFMHRLELAINEARATPAPPVGADWVMVPRELPSELLAEAAFAMDTGNPKHLWDFILAKLEARNA